jgi:hypothetical protein
MTRLGVAIDLPDGQAKNSALAKIFHLPFFVMTTILPSVPLPHEGRTRRHERWKREAMDALMSRDERH